MGCEKSYEGVCGNPLRSLKLNSSVKSIGESSRRRLVRQRSIESKNEKYPIEEQPAKRKGESSKGPERLSYNRVEEQPAKRKSESSKGPERLSYNRVEEQPAKRKSESSKGPERSSHNRMEQQSAKRKSESGKGSERLSPCGICMDKKTKAEMFKIKNCSHSYCLVCIGKHVGSKISENVIKVKCPDLACNGLLEPQDCRSAVPQKVLDRWEAALCESVLGSKKIYCPFKDCSAPLAADGHLTVTSAECPHCHRLFCAQCKVPWHAGSGCKSQVEKMEKKFIDLAKAEKWQKCPNCTFYVQRTHGCESITCRCGYKFCYICGNPWDLNFQFKLRCDMF
ncbi:Uncharacterized RING finger protein [Morus notabilis]|uniref:RBR-type E3 ubiquitin transferase n=1 Tax=Morus notabilis TaxID=981085 RepID=W9R505_9ROSA|nr:Uncharacterized RING finger protein [Morus notabilis]